MIPILQMKNLRLTEFKQVAKIIYLITELTFNPKAVWFLKIMAFPLLNGFKKDIQSIQKWLCKYAQLYQV